MEFDWDLKKATANERKHKGVSFHEAATVFADPLTISFPDPDNSIGEFRFLAFGISCSNRLLVVSYTERKAKIRIIRPVRQHDLNGEFTKMAKKKCDKLRAEYQREDLSQGVRGQYYQEYQKGTNLVLLSPDVAAAFPTEEDVNKALRDLIRIAQRSKSVITANPEIQS